MIMENQYNEYDDINNDFSVRKARSIEISRYYGIPAGAIPSVKKTSKNGHPRKVLSFMDIKKRFEILPNDSKGKLRLCVDKTYKKAIFTGKGFEISDIFYRLYSEGIEFENPTSENNAEKECINH